MPIYAYRCESCGHAKDVLQKISDPRLTTCPVCGAEQFKKQVTSAGFQLKGSGWYVTDFRGGNSTPAADSADKSDGDKSGNGPSDKEQAGGDKSAVPATAAGAAAAAAPGSASSTPAVTAPNNAKATPAASSATSSGAAPAAPASK